MLVFDSSTLILTAKIGLLETLLNGIGIEAVIPRAVEEECLGGRKSFEELVIQKMIHEKKVAVLPVKDRKTLTKIQDDFNLGKGEAEAILLSIRENAALLGIDDRSGINACKLLGVRFATAIALLVRSYGRRLIDRQEALAKLEALARFGRYKDSFIEDARQRLEKA